MLHCKLHYAALYTTLSCTVHCTMLHCKLHYAALYTALWCTVYCTILHCKLRYGALYTVLWCDIHFTILHCTLHYTALYTAALYTARCFTVRCRVCCTVQCIPYTAHPATTGVSAYIYMDYLSPFGYHQWENMASPTEKDNKKSINCKLLTKHLY